MSYIFEGDSEDAKRNRLSVIGGTGIAFNAVTNVKFSEENDSEWITLDEAKNWLRVDVTDDDTLITMLISAARGVCENYANLSFINRNVKAKIHNGLGDITLPFGPVIGDVIYKDMDGNALVISNLNEPYDGDFTAEYNAGFTALPANYKIAILCQIAYMYENRGDGKIADNAKVYLQQVRGV